MIPILLLAQGVGGMESSHGSLNKSAKIPVVIKMTNLRLGLSGNDRIKKEEKHCATSVPTFFNNLIKILIILLQHLKNVNAEPEKIEKTKNIIGMV